MITLQLLPLRSVYYYKNKKKKKTGLLSSQPAHVELLEDAQTVAFQYNMT